MNGTHIHLLLNHFPIIGTLVVCSIMLWAVIKNDARLKNITAVLIIALSVFAFVVNQTGEQADEGVENIVGINEAAIEAHEEAATPAMVVHLLAGLLCIGYLLVERRKLPAAKNLFIGCFVLTLVAFGLMARAGYLGGKIRHTEIAGATANPGSETGGTETGDDD